MWTISKGKNRKGFTLIELMIVIAIIIILAAIAIPNYLKMTERAKKAAIESDLKSLATALETYNTDWATYPTENDGKNVWDTSSVIYKELTGTGTTTNISSHTTTTGENGGIEYINGESLKSIEKVVGANGSCKYESNGSDYTITAAATIGGKTWEFTCVPGGVITISQSG